MAHNFCIELESHTPEVAQGPVDDVVVLQDALPHVDVAAPPGFSWLMKVSSRQALHIGLVRTARGMPPAEKGGHLLELVEGGLEQLSKILQQKVEGMGEAVAVRDRRV